MFILGKHWDFMLRQIFLTVFLYAAGCLFSFSIFAQVPDTKYSDGIAYITGGVGEDEFLSIKDESRLWPIMLELSKVGKAGWGVWISSVFIKVSNVNKQEIFNAVSDGPLMLINLEPGEYVINATFEGISQHRKIAVKFNQALQKTAIFWR